MTIEISFTLDDNDIAYFRSVMNKAQDEASSASEQEIIGKASELLQSVNRDKTPHFVRTRLERLATMIAMLEDKEWPLAGQERVDVVSALAYFHNPTDLIDDSLPVLGLIDDAIMIELVMRELRHELEAYDDFCIYRNTQERLRGADVSREDWLKIKQQELINRMRERINRRNRGGGGSGRLTRFSFFN